MTFSWHCDKMQNAHRLSLGSCILPILDILIHDSNNIRARVAFDLISSKYVTL